MFLVLCVCGGLYLAVLAGKAVLAARHSRRHPAPASARAAFEDVTILQAILGGDPALADTLAANLAALPGARFVWLVDEDDAAGWTAARAAPPRTPDARVVLVSCPPAPADQNPKLFKLARAEGDITTPFLVVLDDDTRLSAIGLTAMLDAFPAHDVATGLPFYLAGPNVPSKLVAQFVNNQSVLTYLPLLNFAPPVTLNGMAYALPTARLRELGGFAPLVHRLTDDLAVARLVRANGGRIFQTVVPHAVGTTVRGFRHHLRIMHRWFLFAWLLVREQPEGWRAAIVLLHGLPPLLLGVAIGSAVLSASWLAAAVIAAVLVLRSAVLALVQRRHLGRAAHAPVWSLVAELLQPFHLLHALVSRRIHWRSRVVTVRADDDFSIS